MRTNPDKIGMSKSYKKWHLRFLIVKYRAASKDQRLDFSRDIINNRCHSIGRNSSKIVNPREIKDHLAAEKIYCAIQSNGGIWSHLSCCHGYRHENTINDGTNNF